jgi:lipid-A-disaccharide synthase-like uncharacterized protein
MDKESAWLAVGLIGQFFFTSRFLVQWLASERQQKSVLPIAFWYLSIFGGAALLCYAVYRRDPVFVLGQSAGLIIYFRNLYFIHRESRHRLPCSKIA